MNKDEILKQQLTAIISDLEKHPNIWVAASVEVEPKQMAGFLAGFQGCKS